MKDSPDIAQTQANVAVRAGRAEQTQPEAVVVSPMFSTAVGC
jgi:hypothetical protein